LDKKKTVSLCASKTLSPKAGFETVNQKLPQTCTKLSKMDKLITISEAAERLGISPTTLRRWEESGKLIPERTQGNQRRYRLSQIEPATHLRKQDRKTLAYARVSSHDQKDDLERQKQVLERYCAQRCFPSVKPNRWKWSW
jgi:excisionase family DNA binding protein